MKRNYIKRVFTNLEILKYGGIYFSGIEGEGEYKSWHSNDNIYIHCFYKNGKLEGEYKKWWYQGGLQLHRLFKDGKIVKDYLE